MKVSRASERDYRTLQSEKSGEIFTRSSVLSRVFSVKGLFFSEEVLPPSHRSSGPHFHSLTDEIIYVVRGRMTAFEGEDSQTLEAGDSACFERGSGIPHYLKNDSDEDCVFLLLRNLVANDAIMDPEPKGNL